MLMTSIKITKSYTHHFKSVLILCAIYLFFPCLVLANSLTLERSDIRYDINSSSQGSGFFVAPEDLTVEQAFEYFQSDSLPQSAQHLTILKTNRPNFKKKHRYWFYIKLNNQTHNQKWVLHFSHFFINHIEIILKPTTAPKASPSELLQFHQFDNHTTDKAPLLNILGRNFPITLTANQDYYLLFEIRAKNYGRPPYVGIMSQNYYDTWEKTLDRYFILSIGIILGLVSIAIICCLFLKDMSFFWFSVSSLCLLFLTLLRSPLLVKWIQISENLPIWFWLLIAFTNISMLMFARSFMLVDSKNKYIIKLLELFVYLYIGIFIISIFSITLINGLLFSVMSVLTMGLIFYSACYKIFKNGAYYLIFMLGWLPIIFLLGESVYTVFSIPEDGSSTFSSKNIREPYFQILHMLLHMVAMLIRIMHL